MRPGAWGSLEGLTVHGNPEGVTSASSGLLGDSRIGLGGVPRGGSIWWTLLLG